MTPPPSVWNASYWANVSAPTVSGISPSSGAAGTTVTVSGSEFSMVEGATTVRFGTAAGTQVSCSSTTTCTATAPPGLGAVDVTVIVNGQTSAISSSDLFSYSTAATPDFGVSASPSSISIGRNQTGSYAVTATSTGGYVGTVAWSVTGGPVGTTFTFSPSSVTLSANGRATSTLTVPRSTPTGTYTLAITGTGTSGSTSHSTTVTLTITGKRN